MNTHLVPAGVCGMHGRAAIYQSQGVPNRQFPLVKSVKTLEETTQHRVEPIGGALLFGRQIDVKVQTAQWPSSHFTEADGRTTEQCLDVLL